MVAKDLHNAPTPAQKHYSWIRLSFQNGIFHDMQPIGINVVQKTMRGQNQFGDFTVTFNQLETMIRFIPYGQFK